MNSFGKGLAGALIGVLVLGILFIGITPMGREVANNYGFRMQKADDRTNYNTKKEVEDEARMMMASYQADKLKYEQYKTSEVEEQKGWAEQAKMRANQTASTYNNFMLRNNFLFKENIPDDLWYELPYLD